MGDLEEGNLEQVVIEEDDLDESNPKKGTLPQQSTQNGQGHPAIPQGGGKD